MPAKRFNSEKPELGYILHFPASLISLARIMEYGAHKYEPMNWAKGGKPDEEYLDACIRHLVAWKNSHIDQESGCNHLGHAIWNLMALLDLNYKEEAFDFSIFNDAVDKLKLSKGDCQ